MNAVVKAEFDRVWLELAELRQSLNARPIAPTPDYRSDLPADDQCGCEESERLKAELGEAQVRAQELESERDVARQGGATLRRMLSNAESQLTAANALLRRCTPWTDELRAAIQAHLSSQPAAPARDDAEQRVLDAVRTVERGSLEYYVKAFGTETGWGAVSAAELARRDHG